MSWLPNKGSNVHTRIPVARASKSITSKITANSLTGRLSKWHVRASAYTFNYLPTYRVGGSLYGPHLL
ncbi:hypothetical protein PAXRUDRAFT_830635 [Paxillus rubicundulus Ve08.2h10]|uniref:Uncharacterized protein n=1 Tax=Paxillus rubicundulus Ve08.2h10 TaxID=930991 RepID=A0A0D0DKF0_9AGAM|nr:hypothetical protein PAXRUDRAFT_830635 [Paxillus rubicundulus Ve08.2h10]